MAKSKKKGGKKNCHMKRAQKMAIFGTSDLLLVFVGGKAETYALDKKSGGPVNIGPSIAASLNSVAFKWCVYLAVLCKDQNGQQYIQSEEVKLVHPYKRELLVEMLNEKHRELIKTCNPLHVLNMGWIASTVPYEFEDQHCEKLFNLQGGWKFNAKWEEDKLLAKIPRLPRCPKCKKFVKKSDYRLNCMEGGPCSKCKGG